MQAPLRHLKTYLTIFSVLFFPLEELFSQSGDQPVPVQGVLINADSEEPLPFATVVLYRTPDSSMAGNALTESDGSFQLAAKPGAYYLQINYMGFDQKTVADLQLGGSQQNLDLGRIAMQPTAVAIEEVTIRGERSQMELKLDRRVFNVGKDLANAGNNAADILDRVPSVTVDPEGNVSLRGSQGVRILVNGKPSGLLSAGDTEALQRMQGDLIESIEVITNPSARYEAEGEAGIINIILKKSKEKGVNGSFGATAGQPDNYGASYNLNYRRNDLNFFSNFGVTYRKSPGGGNSSQRFFENGELTNFFTSETDQLRGGIGGYLQGGLDWNLNDRNVLTASLLYRVGDDDNSATVTYRDFDEDGKLLNTTVREVEEGQIGHNLETSLSFKRSYENPDQEWTVDFKYILNDDTELADYLQTSSDVPDDLLQESSNTEDETNLLLQTDYIYPLGENGRVEGGLRMALRTVDNDFFVKEQQSDGSLITLPNFDDQLEYTENIYAAYLIGAREFGPLGVQVGLRAEYSDITAALLRSGVTNDQNFLSLFPSAAFSYQLTEENQLQMSYSRRLSRPFFRDLLPFSNFNDPRSNGIGNPNLRPEFTDSYEAGFLRYFKNGSLLSSAYFRRTTGVIQELVLPNQDGTSIEYPVNLGIRNSYGLEFSFSYDLTPEWDLTSDLNLFRSLIDGSFEGVDYSAEAFTMSGGIITKYNVSDPFQVQASFDYNAPRNTPQGRRLSSYSFDLAASLDVFAEKGTITLAGRDLFNTRIRRTVVDLPNFQAETSFQWRQTRQVVLTFNYRLNQENSGK